MTREGWIKVAAARLERRVYWLRRFIAEDLPNMNLADQVALCEDAVAKLRAAFDSTDDPPPLVEIGQGDFAGVPAKESVMAGMTHKERAARRHEIAYTVEAGIAPERVASEYTISVTTVRAACQEHGVKCPRKPSVRSVNPMVVLAALLTGEDSHSVIADALGVSTQRVWRLAKDARDAGITLP